MSIFCSGKIPTAVAFFRKFQEDPDRGCVFSSRKIPTVVAFFLPADPARHLKNFWRVVRLDRAEAGTIRRPELPSDPHKEGEINRNQGAERNFA